MPVLNADVQHHFARSHAGLWRRVVMLGLGAILGLVSNPAGADVPDCIAAMTAAIRANTIGTYLPVCATKSAPWTIRLIKGGHGPMTDGTALGVFHMPQPDFIPIEDRPLPVVLMPKSQHVWYVGYLHNGAVLPEFTALRYFVWAPGNNRSDWGPDGVDWGDDAARLFRCLAFKGEEGCVTYYPLPDCTTTGGKDADFFVQVRRSAARDVVAMLDTFGPADDLARTATQAAWEAVCKPGE